MSREIKFRAWDGERKQMFTSAKWVEFRVVNGVLFGRNYNHAGKEQSLKVMQYTGLKDSTGREIYEGDILQPSAYTKSSIARSAVKFHQGYFCLDLAPPYVTKRRPLNLSLENSNKAENGFVVIGNIYENPELLTPPTT